MAEHRLPRFRVGSMDRCGAVDRTDAAGLTGEGVGPRPLALLRGVRFFFHKERAEFMANRHWLADGLAGEGRGAYPGVLRTPVERGAGGMKFRQRTSSWGKLRFSVRCRNCLHDFFFAQFGALPAVCASSVAAVAGYCCAVVGSQLELLPPSGMESQPGALLLFCNL